MVGADQAGKCSPCYILCPPTGGRHQSQCGVARMCTLNKDGWRGVIARELVYPPSHDALLMTITIAGLPNFALLQ